MLVQFLFVAVCRAVCYLLQHAAQFTICCSLPYSYVSYSLIFVAACHTVCYLLLHIAQFSILFSTYCTVSYLLQRAVQSAICHCVLCSWLFIAAQASIIGGKLGTVNCLTTGSTNNHKGLSDKVHCHKNWLLQVTLTISIMLESERPACSSNVLGCPIHACMLSSKSKGLAWDVNKW